MRRVTTFVVAVVSVVAKYRRSWCCRLLLPRVTPAITKAGSLPAPAVLTSAVAAVAPAAAAPAVTHVVNEV